MIKISKRAFIQQISFFMAFLATPNIRSIQAANQDKVFNKNNAEKIINLLTNDQAPLVSDKIHIKAPEIAENGAVVPVTIQANLPNVNKISILVDNNPTPLTSSYEVNPHLEAYISTRVKMAKSSNIIAIVSTKDDQHYSASRSIKVTIGGCGG